MERFTKEEYEGLLFVLRSIPPVKDDNLNIFVAQMRLKLAQILNELSQEEIINPK